MMTLGIFQSERVYEGNEHFLTALYPMPTVSKVVIGASSGADVLDFGTVNQFAPPIFREDSFDPTTRIRRGRFYIPDNPNQRQYTAERVNNFPYQAPISGRPAVYSFEVYRSFQAIPAIRSRRPLVFLGEQSHQTAWKVVGLERMVNGETLVTLKSADTFGLLPELNAAALPITKRRDLEDIVDKVTDASHKYLPVPIVDVCRESARLVLAAWLSAGGDLSDLTKKLPPESVCARAAAEIINRFHTRGKSSEQERQAKRGNDLREISASDAELSVALVGFLFREAGWAT